MTSIDELFKGHSTNKRKLDLPNPSDTANKSTKRSEADTAGRSNGKAYVEDDEDVEAGPAFAPEEETEQDDEEGRFFGGGVSRDTADVLDFIDEQDANVAAPEKIDAAWLRRLALNFERKISKNAELRAKFENDPQKFMGSEADLDAEVKGLSILTDHTELYEEFAKLGCVGSLVSLLAHENTDIAIDALEVVGELLDDDVDTEPVQWLAVAEAMLEADLPDLLLQNIQRLDEKNEADRAGIYHSLSVLENLASQPSIAEKAVSSEKVLKWLLRRMRRKERTVSQNKQYSAEVFAILVQASPKIRTLANDLDALDALLLLIHSYRQRDPGHDSEEEEYVENLFASIICLVQSPEGKAKFVEFEGIALALIMLRESKFCKPRALRLLDHAMAGGQDSGSVEVCQKFVEGAGLKTIFGIFMKVMDQQSTEHVLGIFSSLLRFLPGEAPERIRLLAKFVENGYEKVTRLVELRRTYSERVEVVNDQAKRELKARGRISDEEKVQLEAEQLSRRLDAGLFCVQTLDVIISWLIGEDQESTVQHTRSLLEQQGLSFNDLKATLLEQIAGLELDDEQNEADTIDMLKALVECLG